MVREDALMEHIGVCQQENGLFAHSRTHVLRRVAVEDVGSQRLLGWNCLEQLVETCELILG